MKNAVNSPQEHPTEVQVQEDLTPEDGVNHALRMAAHETRTLVFPSQDLQDQWRDRISGLA